MNEDEPENAAQQTAEQVTEGEAAAVPVPAAPFVRRPRGFDEDDREARIVQGRMWLISFTDLFSILLSFFLLLFSTKDIDLTKFKPADKSGQKYEQKKEQVGIGGGAGDSTHIARVEYGEALNLDYLTGVLKKSIAQAGLTEAVAIESSADHLSLVLDAGSAFIDGTVLSAPGAKAAKGLGESLMRLSNRITVVVPVDEWETGIAQASAFGQGMREGGYRKPFTVLADGSSEDGKIKIRVESDDGRIR